MASADRVYVCSPSLGHGFGDMVSVALPSVAHICQQQQQQQQCPRCLNLQVTSCFETSNHDTGDVQTEYINTQMFYFLLQK